MKTKTLIQELLNMVKYDEWAVRHAAENRYCPCCANEDDAWQDQKKHHAGCYWVVLVAEAEKWLRDN